MPARIEARRSLERMAERPEVTGRRAPARFRTRGATWPPVAGMAPLLTRTLPALHACRPAKHQSERHEHGAREPPRQPEPPAHTARRPIAHAPHATTNAYRTRPSEAAPGALKYLAALNRRGSHNVIVTRWTTTQSASRAALARCRIQTASLAKAHSLAPQRGSRTAP